MNANLTLTQIRYVLAVDQFKNFQKAADDCHVTQPTLSMQIQKLEDSLDVMIFDRSKKPVRSTPLGAQLILQLRKIIQEVEVLETIIMNERSEVAGPFRLGVIPTIAPYLIPLFVTHLAEAYPKLQLTIYEEQTEQIIKSILENRLDAALLVTPLHQNSIKEMVLFYEPFVFYGHDQHKFLKKKSIKAKDLSGEDVWLLNQGHCFRDQVLELCHESSRAQNTVSNLHFESGNLETLKQFVDRGTGYTLLPRLALPHARSQWPKKAKEFTPPVPLREISLVYHESFIKFSALEAIKNEVLAHLPKDLGPEKGAKDFVVPIKI